jgi:hypothetical protein
MSALKKILLNVVGRYEAGTPVTAILDEAVKRAARSLEDEIGPPDLVANPALVDGVWMCVFDSRDLLHQANLAVMTGGALPAKMIPVLTTFQELRPAENFYRNTMVMRAGAQGLLFNYISSAAFTIAPEAPNVFQVSFTTTSMVPADARISPQSLREALELPESMPLSFGGPPRGPFPSIVSYADEHLRINRGETYISVLQRLA